MKKGLKVLLLLAMILSIFTLSSCKSTKKLEKALEKLEEGNCTAKSKIVMDMSITMMGETQNEKVTIEMDILSDGKNVYTKGDSMGEKVESFVKIENDKAKSYAKIGTKWQLLETIDVTEYQNESTTMADVEVKGNFKKEDGVWIGDVDKLQTEVDGLLNSISKQYSEQLGVSIDETKIKNYNITLDGGDVSVIECEMFMKMSTQGISISMNIEMVMEYSKIGETSVTVPEGLPE